MQPDFIQTDGGLIHRATITQVDTSKLEAEGSITLHHEHGTCKASHIQAFEALMLLKPSALEGLRLKHGKGAWIYHNLVSHPLMQFVALGAMLVNRLKPNAGRSLYNLAVSIHDSSVPMPRSTKTHVGSTQALSGRKIIMTAGTTRENIDGVRHYANLTRSESYTLSVASYLVSQGAEVTIIGTKGQLTYPPTCKVIYVDRQNKKIISGQDVICALKDVLDVSSFDAVLCLASISSIKSERVVDQKIKAKQNKASSMTLPVIGNIDVQAALSELQLPILGFDTHQKYFTSCTLPKWLEATAEAIRGLDQTIHLPSEAENYPCRPITPILNDKTIIITSGPTAETLTTAGDVITNFSSGRQGRDLAYAFAQYGANVIYVTGPTALAVPTGRQITVEYCRSALSMLETCERYLPAAIFVGVAAVADFRSSDPTLAPLFEGQRHLLTLEQNLDILEHMGRHKIQRPHLVIGFAAETDVSHILDYAHGKASKKNADLICANLVGGAVAQRGGENNQITFITQHDEPEALPLMNKYDVAHRIAQRACAMLANKRHPTACTHQPTPL